MEFLLGFLEDRCESGDFFGEDVDLVVVAFDDALDVAVVKQRHFHFEELDLLQVGEGERVELGLQGGDELLVGVELEGVEFFEI